MDGLLIGAGLALVAAAIPAIVRPHALTNQSLRNRDRRLNELRSGAEERYFEERRELESYTPRYNPSNQTIRRMGLIGLALGCVSIFQGMTQ